MHWWWARSDWKLAHVDSGPRPSGVFTADISWPTFDGNSVNAKEVSRLSRVLLDRVGSEAYYRIITKQYLKTFGITILKGALDQADDRSQAQVAIVNQSFVAENL